MWQKTRGAQKTETVGRKRRATRAIGYDVICGGWAMTSERISREKRTEENIFVFLSYRQGRLRIRNTTLERK